MSQSLITYDVTMAAARGRRALYSSGTIAKHKALKMCVNKRGLITLDCKWLTFSLLSWRRTLSLTPLSLKNWQTWNCIKKMVFLFPGILSEFRLHGQEESWISQHYLQLNSVWKQWCEFPGEIEWPYSSSTSTTKHDNWSNFTSVLQI